MKTIDQLISEFSHERGRALRVMEHNGTVAIGVVDDAGGVSPLLCQATWSSAPPLKSATRRVEPV